MRGLKHWKNELKAHRNLILISLCFLVLAGYILHLTSSYADKMGANSVDDLILDHIPSIDLTFLLVYGYIAVVLLMFMYPLFFKVKKLHEVILLSSMVVAVRGLFVMLTHLKEPVGAVVSSSLPKIYSIFYYRNDLFFSGHTALPFLGFLIFRKERIGKFFLASTVVMAATVLLMHVHYSIDVFGALFITYGVYRLGGVVLKKGLPQALRVNFRVTSNKIVTAKKMP